MMQQMRYYAWLGVLIGLFLAGLGHAFAQPVPATDPIPRVAFPMTHVGNISTVGPRTADAANAAKFSFGVASNGAIFANTTDRLPTPGGASIPIGVNGTIAKPNVAAALGRFARKALPLLSTGVALYDLGEELGFGLDNSGGSLVVVKDTPLPEGYDGYEYREQNTTGTTWYKTRQAACVAYAANTYGGPSSYYTCLGPSPSNWLYFQVQLRNNSNGAVVNTQDRLYSRRTDPSPPSTAPQPSTIQALEDAIAAKSGWPTSSALARATVDALKSGESLQVEPTAVTGPATSPGGSSQTVNETLGETTTSTVTHHHTYAGPQITTTTVTNNVTTNNSTGAVTSTSTTTTQPVINPSPAANETPFVMPCGIPGAPPCAVKVDETGTPSYDPEKIKLDPTLETKAQELRDKVSGEGDKTGLFTNLRGLFTLPAIRECEPIEMPSVFGMQVPTMDPCPGVVWLRGLMAWIWAGIGFMWCWSQVQSARK